MSQHKSVTICHGPLEKELCCPSTAFPQVPGSCARETNQAAR